MPVSWKKVCVGAIAGLASAFVMERCLVLWDMTGLRVAKVGAYGLDEEVNIETARRIWRTAFHKSLNDEDAKRIASALHHGFGFVSGAAYAALSESWPQIRTGYGTAYGTAVFIVGDEIAVTAAGLSNPLKKPIESHLSALFAHLIFGAVLEGVLRLAGPATSSLKDKASRVG